MIFFIEIGKMHNYIKESIENKKKKYYKETVLSIVYSVGKILKIKNQM